MYRHVCLYDYKSSPKFNLTNCKAHYAPIHPGFKIYVIRYIQISILSNDEVSMLDQYAIAHINNSTNETPKRGFILVDVLSF